MIKAKRLCLILFLMLTVSISYVFAADFEVKATPIKNNIEVTEIGKYNLEIKNTLNIKQTFRIHTMDYPTWDIYTDPIENPILLEVPAYSSRSVELFVNPLDKKNLLVGQHFVKVKIESKTNNQARIEFFKILINSRDSLVSGYVPTVILNAVIPSEIDPRDELPIKISVNNQNIINYSELIVRLKSNLINDEMKIALEPEESKNLGLNLNLDSLTPPQKDSLEITVLYNGKIIDKIDSPFEVKEYSTQELMEPQKSFLRSERKALIASNNPLYSEEFKYEISFMKSLFTSTYPKAKLLKDGIKRYYLWDVKLNSENQMEVKVIEDYRPFFIIILLLIAIIISYYYFRSPIVISKKISNIQKRDGGIDSLKVILEVKNRGKSKISELELTERVPNIVSVQDDISIGTMKPDKVLKHEKKGYMIHWNLSDFEFGEERVLSYKIKANLPILGDLSLDPAEGKFKIEKRYRTTHSNRINIRT